MKAMTKHPLATVNGVGFWRVLVEDEPRYFHSGLDAGHAGFTSATDCAEDAAIVHIVGANARRVMLEMAQVWEVTT